ncbi:MAG: 3'-5' exonuclease [Betaproteobacteria bacterium]|nr:3'-5' exonuclease [Betaproteobacteria bacterium]
MSWLARLFGSKEPAPVLTPEQQAALDRWIQLPAPDLGISHYRTRYVVVDVESSGLHMVKDRLISIGAVAVVDGLIDFNDAFEVILRQDQVSDTANILLHGIGGSAQREGVEPADALLAFLAYVGKQPLVAYHALFDHTMIARAMQKYLGYKFEQKWLDLAWVLPELFQNRIDSQVALDNWLDLFGIENIQRHNAVSDCYATAKLLQVAMAAGAKRNAESPARLMEIEHMRRWLRRAG